MSAVSTSLGRGDVRRATLGMILAATMAGFPNLGSGTHPSAAMPEF
jgi:hypothetical protein